MIQTMKETRENMVLIARRCSNRGMQTGDGGNISVRCSNREMLIMASQSAFADCKEEDFILTDFRGNALSGTRKPSRECILHGAIYEKFPAVNAIVHCHSPYATALASTMRPLPFATYHSEIKLRGEARVFDTGSYIVSEENARTIMDSYEDGEDVKGFLLRKHGVFALGTDIFHACYIAELIEETAQIGLLSDVANNIKQQIL